MTGLFNPEPVYLLYGVQTETGAKKYHFGKGGASLHRVVAHLSVPRQQGRLCKTGLRIYTTW